MNYSFDWIKYQQSIDSLQKQYATQPLKLDVFKSLDSTNKKLWQIINEENNTFPLAVIALQQTSGQGQWGKVWQSPIGGLYLSVALECNLALDDSFHLIMATAEGVTNILRDYQLPVTIKWSNDLILNSHKLGGIKIETKAIASVIKYAVVGIGINWNNDVPERGTNITSYYTSVEQKNIVDSSFLSPSQNLISSFEQLTAITITGILNGYSNYLKLGADYTHHKYQQLLNSIGKPVTINNCQGTVKGVTTQGKLIVCLQSPGASTVIRLAPGEISLGYDSIT